MWPLVALVNPQHVTFQVALAQLNVGHSTDYSMVMAGVLMAVLPLVWSSRSSPAASSRGPRRGRYVADQEEPRRRRRRPIPGAPVRDVRPLGAVRPARQASGSGTTSGSPTRTTSGTSTTSTPTSTTRRRGPEAADAGMRYVVVTTKHHDGFCLWDTALTDYQAAAHARRPGPGRAARRRASRPGLRRRLLPLAHRLAPSAVPDRRAAPAARRRRRPSPQRRPGHRRLPPLPARPGERAADRLRPIDLLWFDFSYPDHVHDGAGLGRQGRARLGQRRAAGAWSGSCSPASWSTTGWASRATS